MTAGVTIRRSELADAELLAGWLSRPEISRWLGSQWRNGPIDPRRIAFALKDRSSRFFTVLRGDEPVGMVAVSEIDAGDGFGMVWYLLGAQQYGGAGVTTRAVQLALDNAFGELELAAVYAWVHPDNAASRRLLEKVGFQQAGRFREAALVDGTRVDRVLLDLPRRDWQSRQR